MSDIIVVLTEDALTDADVAHITGLYSGRDVRFHVLLARAAGNDVLADLLQSLRSMLSVWVGRRVRTRQATEAAYDEHRAILEALRAGDVLAVQRAMDEHMATASARIEHADPVPEDEAASA